MLGDRWTGERRGAMGQDNSKDGMEHLASVEEVVLEMEEIATVEEAVEEQVMAEEVVEEIAICEGGVKWPSLPLVDETATAEEAMEEVAGAKEVEELAIAKGVGEAVEVVEEEIAFVEVVDGVAEVVEMAAFDVEEFGKGGKNQPEVLVKKEDVKEVEKGADVSKEVVKELEQKLEKLATLNRLEEEVASLRAEKGEVLGQLAGAAARVEELATAAVARCSACAALLAAPVYQCKAGHKVCSVCRERVEVVRRVVLGRRRPSCPSCTAAILGRDQGLEELLARVARVLEQI